MVVATGSDCPGFIALTDADWALFLQSVGITEGVNFWSPRPKPLKKDLEGSLLVMLSKKDSPWPRKVIGHGTVREYREETPERAWEIYGKGNGTKDLHDLKSRLGRLGKGSREAAYDQIGCTVLDDVSWIDPPLDPKALGLTVPPQVVRGKTVPQDFVARLLEATISKQKRPSRSKQIHQVVKAVDRVIKTNQFDALCWFDDHLGQVFHGPLSSRGAPCVVVPAGSNRLDGEGDGWWGGILQIEEIETNGPSLKELIDQETPVGVVEILSTSGNPSYRSLGIAWLESAFKGEVSIRGLPPGTFDLLRGHIEIEKETSDSFKEKVEALLAGTDQREKVRTFVARRSGQQAFRQELLELYSGRCAITGYDVPQALEAAHILEYRGPHTNLAENGILMRADLHRLFDRGLFYFDPETGRPVISEELQETAYADLLTGSTLPIKNRPPVEILWRQKRASRGKATYS
jgi:hypothetical protein